MTRIRILMVAIALQAALFACRAAAEPVGIAEVNARLVRLGDPFQVTVTITSDGSLTISQPAFPAPEGLRLTGTGHASGLHAGASTEITFGFVAEYVADEPGRYELGPFRVAYRNSEDEPGEIIVPAVSVEVYEDAPRPVSDIIPGSMSWWRYIWPIALLAILAGLVALFIRVRKKAPMLAGAFPVTIAKSPEQIAVDEIKALPLPDAGDTAAVKTYYKKVDNALRTYLKRRYDVPTRDVTTWEIQQEFNRRKRLDSRVKGVFVLINDCDWVKFAKSRPSAPEIRQVAHRAADTLLGKSIPAEQSTEEPH